MKPLAHNSVLTSEKKRYNYTMCRARIVVENTFRRLKARWRRLKKRNMSVHIPNVVAAACILHNMCEIHGEQFNDAWLQGTMEYGSSSSHPPTVAIRDGRSEPEKPT